MLLAACSEQDVVDVPIPATGKTPIELSVGGVDAPSSAVTRAVITDGTDKTLNPFDVDTKIFMVMKSEYGTQDFDDPDNPSVAKYTVARGDVLVSENDNTNHRSIVKFDATNQRYWDDAHARSSQLDVWAYAQKGMNWKTCAFEVPNAGGVGLDAYKDKPYDTSTAPNPVWSKGAEGEIYPAIRRWRASHHYNDGGINFRQTQTSVMCQDLLFSNNLTNNSSEDNRLTYDFGTRKFPQVGEANMIFYHAMSKITIHIKKGEGFKNTDLFAFSTGNVKLMGFNTEGLFNIKTGQFEYIHEHYDIPEIYEWATPAAGDTYTLEALVIPNVDGNVLGLEDTNSRWVNGSTTKSMEFIIDHNKYEISQDQLYDALNANPANSSIVTSGKVNLEAGKNYVFTFTVSKTQISGLTAQVVPWETVTADNINATNARISLQLEDRGTAVTSGVDFYRTNDTGNSTIRDDYEGYVWSTGYEKGEGSFNSTTWQPTNWYWPDNTTFYHFRAVGDMSESTPAAPTVSNDAFTLTAGETYKDYTWAAPFKELDDPANANTTKIVYNSTYGFDGTFDGSDANTHQIYHGIGPTTDPIKLLMFHMMSDVTIKVKSVTGDAAVQLGDGSDANCTTIKFEKIYKTGSVALGNGLVTGVYEQGESSKGGYSFTNHPAPADGVITWANYGAIPQALAGTTAIDDVILVITTPDKNEYRVSMKDVKATVTNNNIANPYTQVPESDPAKYIIDSWYPGFKYNYSFTLKKTGITDIQATIVDWETVTADSEDVQIR